MANGWLGSAHLAKSLVLGAGAALCSCGAATDQAPLDQQSLEGAAPVALSRAAALAATWQELGLPAASNGPDLASTPSGWFALSRRSLGDSKVPSGWESHLYRSLDGIRWQSVRVSDDPQRLWLRGVAYGAGRYVLAGMRMGENEAAIFHSSDGERWEELAVATGAPGGLADVVFAGGQFFALSTSRMLLRSSNGIEWQAIDLGTTVMPQDVAFGGSQFLLVGSGDIQRSRDGVRWQPTRLDCELPGACIANPDGDVAQGFHTRAVFLGGTYFIDQASSTDGASWQSLPGLYPAASVAGSVIGRSTRSELALWAPGEPPQPLDSVRYISTLSDANRAGRMRWNGAIEPNEYASEHFPDGEPLPEQLDFPIPSGADCTEAACVTVGNQLYLLDVAP